MRNPLTIIADSLAIISEEFDEQRHEMRNINRPVIEALGNILAELQGLRSDVAQYQQTTNERLASHDAQLSNLRKAAFGGNHPAAE